MKIDHLQFMVEHIPGKENVEADAFSRAPVRQARPEDEVDEEDFYRCMSVCAIETCLNIEDYDNELDQTQTDLLLDEVRRAAEADADYQLVMKNVELDDYKCEEWPDHLIKFRNVKDELSIENGLLIKDGKTVVIPEALRNKYLDYLGFGHMSPEKAIQRARNSVWWPGINEALKLRRRTCKTCVERSPSNPTEPEKPHEPATYPFQKIHMDMAFYGGLQWLIVVDQFSGWPWIFRLGKDAPATTVVNCLKTNFANHGIPEVIYSDGGLQFKAGEFSEMCRNYAIRHETSSPHHHCSSGVAENAVKQMKKLIHCTFDSFRGDLDMEKWTKALLLYRNTPRRPSNESPAMLLFGRMLRDGLPTTSDNFQPRWKEAKQRRTQVVEDYRQKLVQLDFKPKFKIGDRVALQDPATNRWTREGIQAKNPSRSWVFNMLIFMRNSLWLGLQALFL